MSEFDPYLKWLGIRDSARPVNYYRLLGLELYESDKDVISMSADRQMTHIRTFQSGPNGQRSQEILNELARARRCLLVGEKKAAYDQQLRATLAASSGAYGAGAPAASAQAVPPAAATAPAVRPIVVDASPGNSGLAGQGSSGVGLNVRTDPNARRKTKNREKKQLIWGLVSWISGGLAAVGLGAYLIGSGIIGGKPNPNIDDPAVVIGHKTPKPDRPSPSPPKPQPAVPDLPKPELPKPDLPKPELPKPVPPSLETPVVWTLDEVAKYPKLTWAGRQLLKSVAADLSRDKVGRLGSSAPSTAGSNGVTEKIDRPKQPGFMIGVSYLLDSDLKVKNLQPVFRTTKSIIGGDLSNSESLLAKPGYAVSEVQVSKLSPINCVRLRFMKIRPKRLDPEVSYLSSWIGHNTGPLKTIANPLGVPIVGTYCDFESEDVIRTIGLIASHDSVKANSGAEVAASVKEKLKEKSQETPKDSPPETNSDIVGRSLPVISRSPVASSVFTSGQRKESIVFVNKLDASVAVYWVDAKSNLRGYLSYIAPGASRTGTSELGVNWYVKKGDVGIATYRAELGKNTAIIDGRDPDVGSFGSPEIAGLQKKPIPSSSDRNKAMKEVKKVYREMIAEIATGDARKNRSNAESLIQDARDTGEDLALQFAMFDAAKNIAIKAGDCRSAILAVQELDRRFDEFDFWEENLNAVMESGNSLGRTGDKFLASDLDAVLRSLIDEAIRKGESRTAGKLVSFGVDVASRNGDARAEQFYIAKGMESTEVAKLRKQYESALKKLARDPENSKANEQKGRYLIVVKNDFDGALECWKMSDDKEYLDIVKDEATPDANASFLARRWRNLGGDPRTAFGRRCYQRAIEVLQAAGKVKEADELLKILSQ